MWQCCSFIPDQVLSHTYSFDLSVACFYLLCASRVQCWENQKHLIVWCLPGVTSKCRQTISLTWDGQGNMTKVHTETFLSPSVCCSCKMLLLSLPFHKQSKGTRTLLPTQHRENKHPLHSECAEDQHFCHLSEKCHSEKHPDSVCSFLLFEERCVLCLHLSLQLDSVTWRPQDCFLTFLFCVTFL